MIDRLVDTGLPVKMCCRVLGVSSPGYYRYRTRPISATQLRRKWLTGLIQEVHVTSRGTYGSRQVHAELTLGMDVRVSTGLVAVLMSQAGIYGLPGPARVKRLRGGVTADDLVNRKFARSRPNELRVTDITDHPTRRRQALRLRGQGRLSNPIVGYSIDSRMKSRLAAAALTNAVVRRGNVAGCVVHTDRASQFRSRKFADARNRHGLAGSMGRAGAAGDNTAMESFFLLLQESSSTDDPGRRARTYASRSCAGSNGPTTDDAAAAAKLISAD